jgi:hypothetical protein
MDISMISMSPDREGDVDLQCDVCPRVWFDAPNDLHVLSLVAAAEAHVRKYHVAVIDADPVDAEADYDEKRAIYVKQQLHHNGHYGVPDHSPGAANVLPGVTCAIPGHCTLTDGTGITGTMIDVMGGPSAPTMESIMEDSLDRDALESEKRPAAMCDCRGAARLHPAHGQ